MILRLVLPLLLASISCSPAQPRAVDGAGRRILRVGHFPNLTHAHALVARHLARTGHDWFEQRLPDTSIEWYTYNAGPSAMEALFAGSIDLCYVGPSPALNAYFRSDGDDVRLLAGATLGGAALVVRSAAGIHTPADFRGKRVATPQLGNTQDVSCRAWLRQQGYVIRWAGGDVSLLSTANPDQLALFQKGELDAAWTIEPWVSRLELEAGGQVYLREDDAVTTVLVASVHTLTTRAELARGFVRAHAELTQWMVEHADEARAAVAAELEAETKLAIAPAVLDRAWASLRFASEPPTAQLAIYVAAARSVGFIDSPIDLSRFEGRP